MRWITALASAALAALLAIPSAQAEGRVPLFSCATDSAGNLMTITGELSPARTVIGLLFTAPDGTVWPTETSRDPNFYLSASDGPEGNLLEVAFGDPGRYFRLFALAGKEGAGDAGLVETAADGSRRLTVRCTERPTIYQGDLNKATLCDDKTALGAAACNVLAPPTRTAPLELPSAQ